ncbi:MAG: DUF3124 domain-containing protein [Chloroflexi bacterium]|nr:DUF3124 domain-containing protein [Chloroflexota bacterium]
MLKIFYILIAILIILFTLNGCQGAEDRHSEEVAIQGSYTIERIQGATEIDYKCGELIYVPIYSSIFRHPGAKTHGLTATLSIHNIDLTNSIKITKVDYYNTDGELIKAYIEDRLALKPLQTVQFVIWGKDISGGTGANFIVEWVSESDVSSPIVEAVTISTSGLQGVSFVTSGKVIKKLGSY